MPFITDQNGFTFWIDDASGQVSTPVNQPVYNQVDKTSDTSGRTGVFTPSGAIIPWNEAPYGVDNVVQPDGRVAAVPRQTYDPVVEQPKIAGFDLSSFLFPKPPAGTSPVADTQQLDPIMLMLLMGNGESSTDTLMMMLILTKSGGFKAGVDLSSGIAEPFVQKPVDPWQQIATDYVEGSKFLGPLGGIIGAIRGLGQPNPNPVIYY